MKIYIPQKIDPYNTHLKNLVEAYSARGHEVITGYTLFESENALPEIVHFHFLEALLKYLKYDEKLFFDRLDYMKNRGVRFVYTFHDFKPHSDIREIDYPVLFDRFLAYIDLFVHHGARSILIIKEAFPKIAVAKHIVCHHGDYLNDMKMFHETQENSREILNLIKDKKIILIFGQLQFKNTSFAKEVFEHVKEDHNKILLLMAGVSPVFPFNRLNKIYYRFNNAIINKFRTDTARIYRRFSQYETFLLFNSSDVIFLPHKSGLTTGLIPLAATLGKPIVYPDIGVFEEQAGNCFALKYQCNDVSSAVEAINKVLSSGIKQFDNSLWLENNNWTDHAEKILTSITSDVTI